MNDNSLPEPLDDFLRHAPNLPADAALKNALLQRTADSLPRRRPRRWPFALAAAAAVGLALVSAYLVVRSLTIVPSPKNDLVEHKKEPTPDNPAPPPEPEKPAPKIVPVTARTLEWHAFDAEDERERVRLYFKAGDLYLDQLQDYDSALRCYHQAFHYCEAKELEFDPDDNWLVMALKRDHRKEK